MDGPESLAVDTSTLERFVSTAVSALVCTPVERVLAALQVSPGDGAIRRFVQERDCASLCFALKTASSSRASAAASASASRSSAPSEDDVSASMDELAISNEIRYIEGALVVVIVKKNKDFTVTVSQDASAEASTPAVLCTAEQLSHQLQIVELGRGGVFESLLTIVSAAFEPFLSSYASGKLADDKEASRGVSAIRTNLEELRLSLLQQQTAIPEVNLAKHFHADLKEIAEKIKTSGEKEDIVVESVLGDRLNNADYVNLIQRGARDILKDIQQLVEMSAPAVASTLQEVNYWVAFERVLSSAEQQFKCPEISVMLAILRKAKRFAIVNSLMADIGLRSAIAKAREATQLLRELPISELLACREVDKIALCVSRVFDRLSKFKGAQAESYSTPRVIALTEAISRDLLDVMVRVLSSMQLLDMPYDNFDKVLLSCEDIFTTWDQQWRQFQNKTAVEGGRRRGDRLTDKAVFAHAHLQHRLESLRKFRRQHEDMHQVVSRIVGIGSQKSAVDDSDDQPASSSGPVVLLSEYNAVQEISSAFDVIRAAEKSMLDISKDGDLTWDRALREYSTRVDRVETFITTRLRDRLGAAKNANEMFRIFSKFSALLFRPRVRGAIQEYQSRLLEKVREDMRRLQDKFKSNQNYKASETCAMSNVRDIPTVSSFIIWTRQIEKQLVSTIRRLDSVLGNSVDRLLSLRRAEGCWTLDEAFCEFLAVPLARVRSEIAKQPALDRNRLEVQGTAVALAFLETVFPDGRQEWGQVADDASRWLTRELMRSSFASSSSSGASLSNPSAAASGGAVGSASVSSVSASSSDALSKDMAIYIAKQALLSMGVGAHHVEGKNLRSEGDSFRKKLGQNVTQAIESWSTEMLESIRGWGIFQQKTSPEGHLMVEAVGFVLTVRRHEDASLELAVNFPIDVITLIKEVKALWWLNLAKAVPAAIQQTALCAVDIYPVAVSLTETLRTLKRTQDRLMEHEPVVRGLVAAQTAALQKQLTSAFKNVAWGSDRARTFSMELANSVSAFDERVSDVLSKHESIQRCLNEVSTSPLTDGTLGQLLGQMQDTIDSLNLSNYTNLPAYVEEMEQRIEAALTQRLREVINAWVVRFNALSSNEAASAASSSSSPSVISSPVASSSSASANINSILDRIGFAPFQMEIQLRNRSMAVEPSIEHARSFWIGRLHACLSALCDLPRLRSARFDQAFSISAADSAAGNQTYRYLLSQCLTGSTLQSAFAVVEKKILEASNYVKTWLQYQSLWDMDAEACLAPLGDDLRMWQQLLIDVSRHRREVERHETRRDLGSIVIEYRSVQGKVEARYAEWQREVSLRYRDRLGAVARSVLQSLRQSKQDLEASTLDSGVLNDAVDYVTRVQDVRRRADGWRQSVEQASAGQRLLDRARVPLPADWIHADQLEGEWSAFSQILERRSHTMTQMIEQLQAKVLEDSRSLDQKLRILSDEWKDGKPSDGAQQPSVALNTVAGFEARINRVSEDSDRISKAREALDLEPDHGMPERVQALLEEIRGLRSVWGEVSRLWNSINELRDTPFATVVPRKVRSSLDEILTASRALPGWMANYSPVLHLTGVLKSLLRANVILSELRSDAIRDRHWRMLWTKLRSSPSIVVPTSTSTSDLTLGAIWDTDLLRHETLYREIIRTAQGEMALEEFLRTTVKECWNNYPMDTVDYQGKCRLLRGWDDMFSKLAEHLNSLGAMKMSPYYKVFEEEANTWEDKLQRLRQLLDVWVEVQRRWVYLESIFVGSADIKHQLPAEFSRFKSIDAEFTGLMRKVTRPQSGSSGASGASSASSASSASAGASASGVPLVLDALAVPKLQQSFERVSDMLSKIQRALGEYLERQRSAFPRFYFVGDEDLLEMLGGSKDPQQVARHLKKMFAGLAAVQINDSTGAITHMLSREGESVALRTPVPARDVQRVHEWLNNLEKEMKTSLALLTGEAVEALERLQRSTLAADSLRSWVDQYPAQIVVLAWQVWWTQAVEKSLSAGKAADVLQSTEAALALLADLVLSSSSSDNNNNNNASGGNSSLVRRKFEHLITELVHQRDVIRALIRDNISNAKDFSWLYFMRFYWDNSKKEASDRLIVQQANASFTYGFEYFGVADRLVQTPLTDRAYLTLTQALAARLGGSPFGPAGTGKTETVKALGMQLGRFVLVFNCDENFDFKAMGRIFVGLCQCGAWGCFDEFNRLEERILSAVSQQIQIIQEALRNRAAEVELPGVGSATGRVVRVSEDTWMAVTLNPGYAGRSNLPDNLKQLFRSFAMNRPDREMIAQVMLYSQGFRTAEALAAKAVPFFQLCADQLSQQSHYDFGLRALKSVLVSAGNLKRTSSAIAAAAASSSSDSTTDLEQGLLLRSISETLIPKLVAEDIPLLRSLLSDVFPGAKIHPAGLDALRTAIIAVAAERGLVCGDRWLEKVLQVHQIACIHHGFMLVGPSGSGKSAAWRVLLEALKRVEGVEGMSYVIDPKSLNKEELYGRLDPTTREWKDGVFTHVLRRVVDGARGESSKRHWIVFDGDVDPEWVENLNSLLDDNKLLTLPNGERLALPPNVRIVFEVQDLKYATLATVSRCGMVWYSDDVVDPVMSLKYYLSRLSGMAMDSSDWNDTAAALPFPPAAAASASSSSASDKPSNARVIVPSSVQLQRECAEILAPFFETDGLVARCLTFSASQRHIMDFTLARALTSFCSLLSRGINLVHEHNLSHPDFPLNKDHLERYLGKRLLFSLLWGLCGSANHETRVALAAHLASTSTVPLPGSSAGEGSTLLDYEVRVEDGEWWPWKMRVPSVEIEPQRIPASDVVVPTVDTARHEEVLVSWISSHRPLLLCGPPGSGKTMTLTSVLRFLPDFEPVFLNFSSATQPDMILKALEQYCETSRTPDGGVVLRPAASGKWMVVFCDEINLPSTDKYGTQRVISLLRQFASQGGFWRASDCTFVRLERIQFVGACNPPTDPGRVPLSHRFLRHSPLLLVDFPSPESLRHIYAAFNRALLRLAPHLRSMADPLTSAMVELYTESQKRFTPDMQPHYIYSPRELSRWVRAMYEALRPLDCSTLSIESLLRLWAHEALRLFSDRLVAEDERRWTDTAIDRVASHHFPSADVGNALRRPILFSNWLTRDYISVDREELRTYVQARLRSFCEEELDVQLVVFDQVLDHVLRIDRVLRQPMGHCLLVGVSGAGKTVLSRFVAWMNGLSVFQIKAHKKYTLQDFEEDLRTVMKRAACKSEKICFIFDESNVLDSAFLEYMNALLASGEVPGLFEGDEHVALMHACREATSQGGAALASIDTEEELYRWFISQVQRNLHVVFTMNPAGPDFSSRASTSPALFNRCVIDWFGEWSEDALNQVADEFTRGMDLDDGAMSESDSVERRSAVVGSVVSFHRTVGEVNQRLGRTGGRRTFITPRHYLDFIRQFRSIHAEKRSELEEQQLHLNVGLQKLKDTEQQVSDLRISLRSKEEELTRKNAEANAKLQQMLGEQQEAERRRQTSVELSKQLELQGKGITERSETVHRELGEAEPALEDAKASVRKIKKQHLDELRALANPPAAVKKTLEAVSLLLGKKEVWGLPKGTPIDWATIRGLMRGEDFIPSIVSFETSRLTEKARARIMKEYMDDPGFTYDAVNNASKACGPMVKWVQSQVRYSEIMESVAPLRNELDQLETQYNELNSRREVLDSEIAELEASITRYKEEYAMLIAQVGAIKSEMTRVAEKLTRSTSLLSSLSQESHRWESQSGGFRTQMGTLVGDSLLSSAFVAYIGFFDEYYRHEVLMPLWQRHLQKCSISTREGLSMIEYLSTPAQRQEWTANTLPSDDLCLENAIIMQRASRYPLIIDPSGQAIEFLSAQFRARNIAKTSFLDPSFLKSLESALRFGCPLLVQDAEYADPILNPILNREVKKTGGRTLVRLGSQDIDLSPAFSLYLATRDPTHDFPPDLCSRVTLVNFTVTPRSLHAQCLNAILHAERPDIEARRADVLKLQGEYRVRLRDLETRLLNAISEARGNILDDDKVMATLEQLKAEAAEVGAKASQTEQVFSELSAAADAYEPVASACARVYFATHQLSDLHFLYHNSLPAFLDALHSVLRAPAGSKLSKASGNAAAAAAAASGGVIDLTGRLSALLDDLFSTVYTRVARSLLHEDRLAYALRLSEIRLRSRNHDMDEDEADFLLRGSVVADAKDKKKDASSSSSSAAALNFTALDAGLAQNGSAVLTAAQKKALSDLSLLSAFRGGVLESNWHSQTADWINFLTHAEAESHVPSCWKVDGVPESVVTSGFRRLLVLKSLRPDRLISALSHYIRGILGDDFLSLGEREAHLSDLVDHESDPYTPILLCSAPGFDASGRVEELAQMRGSINLSKIAMGSPEGYEQAEKALSSGIKNGQWVLLKNVHLAPHWLSELEKRLHGLQLERRAAPTFRLFLTSEIHPALPANLLRRARVLAFEPPPGVRANLLHTFDSLLPAERVEKEPVERARLHLLVAWLHAVVQERLRFAPLGWTKRYEFNESDLRYALDTVDTWVNSMSHGRTNVAPASLPWPALRTLLAECIYGGRIDNEFDAAILKSFIEACFRPEAYESGPDAAFALATPSQGTAVRGPDGPNRKAILEWLSTTLPENESPDWLGLPNNVSTLLLARRGLSTLTKSLRLRNSHEDETAYDASATSASSSEGGSSSGRPAWARMVESVVPGWQKTLPQVLAASAASAASSASANPLIRCVLRELAVGSRLLEDVHRDLKDLLSACSGTIKLTNYLRSLIDAVQSETVPAAWRRYPVASDVSLSKWVSDLARRLSQLQSVWEHLSSKNSSLPAVTLGLFFFPEAFITATRQVVAQRKSWPLEALIPTFVMDASVADDDQSFHINGFTLECAQWTGESLGLSSDLVTSLPTTRLRWVNRSEDSAAKLLASSSISVPIYLNHLRRELLITVEMSADATVPRHVWLQRGVAISAWSSSN